MTESIDQPQTSESHDAVIAEALAVIDQALGRVSNRERGVERRGRRPPARRPHAAHRRAGRIGLSTFTGQLLDTGPRRGAVRLARARGRPRSPAPAVEALPSRRAAAARSTTATGSACASASPACPIDWVAEHTGFVRNEQFVDRMVSGPVRRWEHTHRFRADGPAQQRRRGHRRLRRPVRAARRARRASPPAARCSPSAIGARAATSSASRRSPARPSMRIAVTGASGLIGRELVPFLTTAGHRSTARASLAAVRRDLLGSARGWSTPSVGRRRRRRPPRRREHRPPWTVAATANREPDRRHAAAQRTLPTPRPPRARVDVRRQLLRRSRRRVVDETAAAPGSGDAVRGLGACHRAGIARDPCRHPAQRVVSRRGRCTGDDAPAVPARRRWHDRSGEQYVSWIAVDDLVGAIYQAIHDERLSGPVNAVAPNPVTSRELTQTLGRVLRRPTVLPVPASAVGRARRGRPRAAVDERAGDPDGLDSVGFRFDFPTLEDALRFQLGRLTPDRSVAQRRRGGGGGRRRRRAGEQRRDRRRRRCRC